MTARFRPGGRRAGLRTLLLCALFAIVPPLGHAGATYIYDDLGRVVEVTNMDGSSTVYTYDASGNILAIDRSGASGLKIATFSPTMAHVGSVVSISGNGFSAVPSENVVTIGGARASVTDASTNTLTVIVPSAANSGPMSVAVGVNTAVSSQQMTVLRPVITGFTPAIVNPGALVTITGSNFNLVPGSTVITTSGVIATINSLTNIRAVIAAPTAGGTGFVQLSTSYGSATSTDHLMVLPAAVPAANVTSTATVIPGTTQSVSVPTAGKTALLLFDGTQGQHFSLLLTSVTMSGTLTVYRPDGASLASTSVGNNVLLDLPALPMAGRYVVVLSPGSGAGGASVQLLADSAGTVNTDGTPLAVTLASGQNASFSFNGVAGASYGVALTNLVSNPGGASVAISIIKPDGSVFTSGWNCGAFTATSGNCDISPLPVSGTYTLRLDPSGLASTSFNLNFAQAIDGGTLVANGATYNFNSSVPGRNASYTFSGSTGQRLSLIWTSNTVPAGSLAVFSPSGSLVASVAYNSTSSGELAIAALTASGTYTVMQWVDGASTGHLNLRLVSEIAAGTVNTDGTPVSIALDPGQNALLTFTGTAGVSYGVALTNIVGGTSISITVLKPDGTVFTSGWNCVAFTASSGNCDISPLPVSGTYTIRLDPSGLVATSFKVYVPQEIDGGALVVNGATYNFNSSIPGRNATYTFDGSTGQRLSLIWSSNTVPAGTFAVYSPSGSVIVSGAYNSTSAGEWVIPALTATGTYKIVQWVDGVSTGHLNLRLVGEIAEGSISTDGTPVSIALDPGQNAVLTFSGTAGVSYGVALTNIVGGASISITFLKPDGTVFTSGWNCVAFTASSGNCDISPLPVSGTYTIRLNPSGVAATSFNLYLPQAIDGGALVVNGAAYTYSSSVPGRNATYTFDGTSGQLLSLVWSNNTIPAGTFAVSSPSGSTVASVVYNGTSSGTLTIPALPATGTYRVTQWVDGVSTGHLDVKVQTR